MAYECITTLAGLRAYLGSAKIVAFDFETAPDDRFRGEEKAALDAHKAHIVGVSFSVAHGSAVYVPVAHRAGANIPDPAALWAWLREAVFENTGVLKIAHNMSFEAMYLYAMGIVLQPPCYDTIAAAQMTLKSRYAFRTLADSGLKTLVPALLHEELPSFLDVTEGRTFDELDAQDGETVRYACADSDFALRLYDLFNGWFDRYLPKHRVIVEQVESPTAIFAGLMKYNGVLADTGRMQEKQAEADARLQKLRGDIAFIIGDVSIGANASTAAFKSYLYKTLGLPVMKMTAKFQEAMDDEALILLKEWCAKNRPELEGLFDLVQEYRRWGKIKSTYIDGYMQHVNTATGRVHPDLMPLATETGRFASRNPNLQNCFDEATEILTPRGFIPFAALTREDLVAQWQDGTISFTVPTAYVDRKYHGTMIHLTNQHIDLCMTPDHLCLLQNRKTRQFFTIPAEIYPDDVRQLHAGRFRFGEKHLQPAEVILLAATQADGSYQDGGINFSFSKARKYRRLVGALQALHAPYSDHVRGNGLVNLRLKSGQLAIWIRDLLGSKKVWGSWLLDFDQETVDALRAEIYHWDGCFTRTNHYSSSIKENADWMQILHILSGQRTNLRRYHNGNPMSPDKLYMGLPGYGWNWRIHDTPENMGMVNRGVSNTYYAAQIWLNGGYNFTDDAPPQPFIPFVGFWDDYDKVPWAMPHVYDYMEGWDAQSTTGPVTKDIYNRRRYLTCYGKSQRTAFGQIILDRDGGSPDARSGNVIVGDKVTTLGANGTATYNFNVPNAGAYDVAIQICFPFWDKNGIVIALDGAATTFSESRLWWPYWRMTCWLTLAKGKTLSAGQHSIVIRNGVQGSQFYGFRVCTGFTAAHSAGEAVFDLHPRSFKDVGGNMAVPDKGFRLTTEVLRRKPESALAWYEDFRDESPLKDTYYKTISGEWKVWKDPDGESKRPYSQLEGQGQLAWNFDKFSEVHLRARIAFPANGTGRAGVYLGNIFCCINIDNQCVELYQGGTKRGSWQGEYRRTADVDIRKNPSMYLLEFRKRGNKVRVYSGSSSNLRYIVDVTATMGYAGIQSDGPIKCELLRLGDAWTYEPYEAVDVVMPDGSTVPYGRIQRSNATWDTEFEVFRLTSDIEEGDTRSESISLDYDFMHSPLLEIPCNQDYTATVRLRDINLWVARLFLGDADGFSILYYQDVDSLVYWSNQAAYRWKLRGIAIWSLGQEDMRLWEALPKQI